MNLLWCAAAPCASVILSHRARTNRQMRPDMSWRKGRMRIMSLLYPHFFVEVALCFEDNSLSLHREKFPDTFLPCRHAVVRHALLRGGRRGAERRVPRTGGRDDTRRSTPCCRRLQGTGQRGRRVARTGSRGAAGHRRGGPAHRTLFSPHRLVPSHPSAVPAWRQDRPASWPHGSRRIVEPL